MADLAAGIRQLVNPDLSEQDRWLLRLYLLQVAGVEPTAQALAFLGGTTETKVRGAMAILQAEGLATFEQKET